VKTSWGIEFLLLLAMMFVLSSCSGPSMREVYERVLVPCSVSDLQGTLSYFGPANNLGPGTVLRIQEKGYGLSFRLQRLITDQTVRDEMINISNRGKCEGSVSLKKKIAGKLGGESLGIEANLGFELKKAEKMSAEISSFRWVDLEQSAFENAVDETDSNSSYKRELATGTRYVVTRALLVKGLIVSYEFSIAAAADVKAKYPDLNIDTALDAFWKNDTTLKIRVTDEFYIAGEIRNYTETGLAGGRTRFGPEIDLPKDTPIYMDSEN